jgi:hypothetical protein
MGREIGWKVALLRSGHAKRVGSFEGLGGIRIADLGLRIADLRRWGGAKGEKVRRFEGVKGAWPRRSAALQSGGVRVVAAGPKICRKIGIVTGGFGDLDQVVEAGLDTLVTGEADYPTEVKARELGINLLLAGHKETETFGVELLARRLKNFLQAESEKRKK